MHSAATKMFEMQQQARNAASGRFKINNRDIIDAHHLASSALASAIESRTGMEIATPSPQVEGRIALLCQFAIGIEHCESSIAEGLYAQSAALLKQEIETIAAIEEYRNGNRGDGRTPNPGRALSKGFGELYGRLNEISHPSRHHVSKNIVSVRSGGKSGASIAPRYDGDLARELYGQHVCLIQLAVKAVDRLFEEVYGSGISAEEKRWCGASQTALLRSGLITISSDAQGREADWLRSQFEG